MLLGVHLDREAPAWRIMEYLQRQGSGTIKDLERHLGVTTTAVRQQLQSLHAEGYVERKCAHAGVGRPHHVYSATEKAQDLFTNHSNDLALTLLEEVLALEGKEITARLLGRVGSRLAAQYAQTVDSGVLRERVEQLAEALSARGVLAEITEEDDTILLHIYNCPYHELAQEHREICEMDKQFMRELLGSDVKLTECMMDGHHRCSFVVSRSAP
jgi:DeoR family transcriptional regulator, suf operon transcriptional repressor